jgi:hypothetical protein
MTKEKDVLNSFWSNKIDIVEHWLAKRGYKIVRGRTKHIVDSVDFEMKLVFLSERSKEHNQLFSILHECGHILNRDKNFNKKYKALSAAEKDPRKLKTMRFLVEEIEEETEAWRRGEILANKLNLELDTEQYYNYASKFLMTYVVTAAKGKGYLIE